MVFFHSIARTRHPVSPVEAIVSFIPLRNGSVFKAGRANSIYAPPWDSRMLLLVGNHFPNPGPKARSASL